MAGAGFVRGNSVSIAIAILLLLVGLLNFYPVVGVLGGRRLERLYGVRAEGADLSILMRHRALLFSLVGAFIVYAAFEPALRGLAFVAGFVSMLGFVALAWMEKPYGKHIAKVVAADLVASAALAVALLLQAVSGPGG